MNTFRAWVKTVGGVPLILIAIGIGLMIRRSRAWWAPLWVGILWAAWNVLYSKREISATVTEGTPSVSYTVSPPTV